jgi:ABC-type nitrate/sulfonate/bicarbonate transport system permease component
MFIKRVNILGILTIVALVVLWEYLIRSGIMSFEYIPAPSQVVGGFIELIHSGELQRNLSHTVVAALLGWLCAGVVGILLGSLLGLSRPVWLYTMASVESLRALPIVAFVPVAVLLLGFTSRMEIVVAFYAALWPILINTYGGIRSVDRRLLEVGYVLDLRRREVMWKLRLPSATPFVMVGLRLGLSVSFILTLVAEMIGNPAGLGYALVQAGQALQPAQMFAYLVVIGLIGVVLNGVLMISARLLFRGQMEAAGDTT